jgi:hypothetical protein
MSRSTFGGALALMLLCACGPFRIGPEDGVRPIEGTARASRERFNCPGGGDCMLLFDGDLTLIREEDYAQLDGLPRLFKGAELEVKRVAFRDEDTGAALEPKTAALHANGQLLVTEADLSRLPKTVALDDCALAPVRSAIHSRQAVVVHVSAQVTLASPPPHVALDYEVQPTLLVGP